MTEHVPGTIGDRDREGWRTFQTPGDVCLGCSDPAAGRWVPVTQCETALAIYELQQDEFERGQEAALRYLTERGDR